MVAFLASAGVFLLAVGTQVTQAAPFDPLIGLAALITALVGVISLLVSVSKGKANDKKVKEAEEIADNASKQITYLKGFSELTEGLQREMDRLNTELVKDRAELDECRRDRLELREEIGKLKHRLDEGGLH